MIGSARAVAANKTATNSRLSYKIAANLRKKPADLRAVDTPGFETVDCVDWGNYSLNNENFWPKYILMTVSAPSIKKEKIKGGLWNRRITKSVTKRLVNNGWSIKPLIIFLNMSFPGHSQYLVSI